MRYLLLAVVAVGCGRGSRGTPGTERGDCRTGEPRCESGLLCLSNVCVRPPGADCTLVGETLASLDLGNYAEPEERAPVMAKYRAACDTARVTKEEGECLDAARDKWTATQCAPRMFPELADATDCDPVIARLEQSLRGQVTADNPQAKQWLDTTVAVMRQSCAEDAWPRPLKQCVLMASATGDAMQTCAAEMPAALPTKLQERLQTAMQTLAQ